MMARLKGSSDALTRGASLVLNDLSVSYGQVRALVGVTLEVAASSFQGVLGANGAGKTTLLKAISGTVNAKGGTVSLDGTAMSGMAPHRIAAAGVAHVPEGRRVFNSLSVLDNLELGAYARRSSRKESLEEVFAIFPRLAERKKQLAGSLSGGEQQMLTIGRALMLRPRLLLLDEPSLGLAPVIVEDVFSRLVSIHREMGVTIVLIEQNAVQALEVIDRAIVLENGRVVVNGSREELASSSYLQDAYLGTTKKTDNRPAHS